MPKYESCFACSLPDELGSGCPDNDFYAEHPFEGTYAEAEREAKRISWEVYRGDFSWRIVKDDANQSLKPTTPIGAWKQQRFCICW
jgi:hypothetical protein